MRNLNVIKTTERLNHAYETHMLGFLYSNFDLTLFTGNDIACHGRLELGKAGWDSA